MRVVLVWRVIAFPLHCQRFALLFDNTDLLHRHHIPIRSCGCGSIPAMQGLCAKQTPQYSVVGALYSGCAMQSLATNDDRIDRRELLIG